MMKTFSPRPDEAQLAPGDLFDRIRILTQAPRFFAQTRVFRALTRHRRRGGIIFAPRPHHGQQPAVAHQAVDDKYRCHEEDEPLDDAAVAPRPARGVVLVLRLDGSPISRFATPEKHYNNARQSTRGGNG